MINLSGRTIKTIELLSEFTLQIDVGIMPILKSADKSLFEEFVHVLKESANLYESGNWKLAQDKLNLARHFASDSLPIFEYPKFLELFNKFEDDLKVLR